jgi:hypothetical protein
VIQGLVDGDLVAMNAVGSEWLLHSDDGQHDLAVGCNQGWTDVVGGLGLMLRENRCKRALLRNER